MVVNVLPTHLALRRLDFKPRPEIPRLIQCRALLRNLCIGLRNLPHHLLADCALVLDLHAYRHHFRLERLQAVQKIARLFFQPFNRIVVALDAFFAPLDRAEKLVAPLLHIVALLRHEGKLLLHLARRDAPLGQLLRKRHRPRFEILERRLAFFDEPHHLVAPVQTRRNRALLPDLDRALAIHRTLDLNSAGPVANPQKRRRRIVKAFSRLDFRRNLRPVKRTAQHRPRAFAEVGILLRRRLRRLALHFQDFVPRRRHTRPGGIDLVLHRRKFALARLQRLARRSQRILQ